MPGCDGQPDTQACQRLAFTVRGAKSGPILPVQVT